MPHCSRRGLWLRCAWLAALSLSAVSHEDYHKPGYEYGSGSGGFQFPTPTVVGFEYPQVIVRESRSTVELCAVVYEPLITPLTEEFSVSISTQDGRARAGMDYEAVAEVLGPFNDTHRRLCLEVPLIDDLFCERNPYPEDFTAVMMTDNENVTVSPTRIGVVIEDRFEPECVHVTIGFEETMYNTIEEIGYIHVCVKVFSPIHVPREVFVTISTHDNSAKAERDYVPLRSVTLGPLGHYTIRRCVPVVIIDDSDCERRAERFILFLEKSENLISFSNNNVPVIIDGTTEQTDCASVRVGFVQPYYTVREGDGEVTVCVGAFEPQRFGARFDVTADTRDDTAVSGSDYVALEDVGLGLFDEGSRRHCFVVGIVNDRVCGDDSGRFFEIELSSYADLVQINPKKTRIYIYDAVECIQVHLGLDITTYSVQEDQRMVTMCATVFSPSVLERMVEAFVTTRDGSAVAGSDYVAMTNQRLTFSEAARRVCFNTTIMNDANCEQFEFFIVFLSSPAQKVVVSPSTGYVIIHDPPFCTTGGVQVRLEQQSYTTFEGAGSVEICAVIVTEGFPSTHVFSLLVSTQDGSAKSPSDYIALTDERVGPFGPSTPRACFTISITQDSVCEGGEEVFSAVVRNDGSMVEVITSGSVASITIEDSAVCIPVVLGFEQLSYTVRETDGSAELCVNITEPAVLRRNVTLTVETLPLGGSGFGSGLQFLGPLSAETVSQTLGPFTNDRRRLCITMPITDDEMCGESLTESFSVQLTTDDPNVTLTPAAATLVIRDSPQCTPGTVTFDQSQFISSEELGWAVVCASLSGPPPSSAAFSLLVSSFDDTANAGVDYVSVTQNLTFGPASMQQCFPVLLVQDRVCETTMTERFYLMLTNSQTVIDTASVVIYDAPECITVNVGFAAVTYALGESSGSVPVCVEVSSPHLAEREFFLMVTSNDRDAVAGSDYTQVLQEPLGPFSLSQRRHCIDVSVLDDSVCEEPEESFTLSLSTEEEFIDIVHDSVTVYIQDVGEIECVQVRVGFESTSYILSETVGKVEVCVSLPESQPLQFDFNLTIATVDGSATGGQDFSVIDQMLMFEPTQRRRCINVTILNDQECEDRPNEMFTVVLRGEDPRLVIRANVLTVTIDEAGEIASLTDPDCFPLEIYFTADTPTVRGDSVEIAVATRGRGLPQTITCDLIKRGVLIQTHDCTNGNAIFTNIRQKGTHYVKATVVTGRGSVKIERKVRVNPDPTACSVHLINRGVSIAETGGGRATAEFVGVGPIDSFRCVLNGVTLSNDCASPLELSGLVAGHEQYTLRLIPTGTSCTNTKNLKQKFLYVEPYSG